MPEGRVGRRGIALTIIGAGVIGAASWLFLARATTPGAISSSTPRNSIERPPLFADWVRFEQGTKEKQEIFSRHYIDALLGHQVFRLPPSGLPEPLARQLLLDDDELLLSSGRRLWNRKLMHQPGLTGQFCYVHSNYCLRSLFEVSFFVDGHPSVVYDNQYWIERYPSHTTVHYKLPEVGIDEHKFITYDDRAVVVYEARSSDGQPHDLTFSVNVPYQPVPGGDSRPAYPLLGQGQISGLPLYLYVDAPGFERSNGLGIHLQKTVTVAPGQDPARASLNLHFANEPRATSEPVSEEDLLADQVQEYHRWFAENVPYFDAPDRAFKKMWYYRWWVVRFHLIEAHAQDLSGFAFYEGKLGFDNVISFAVPAQLKELTYLRDPRYGLSQARNAYRSRAQNGAVVDAPGSPYWGETYSHWIALALAEYHRVHPLPYDELAALLSAAAEDVRAWLTAYDKDGDGLPERDRPRVTGYDLDILSYWFFNGLKIDRRRDPPALERVDFASFVYGNATAVAELAEAVGNRLLAEEFRRYAARLREATLRALWDETSRFFYPRTAMDDARIPIRELHGFFPFLTLLAPDEARYIEALRRFTDPGEFWGRFPPVITSIAHYRAWTWEMDGLTRNIAPHPISMGANVLLRVLKHYHQDIVTPEHFMELMARYNDLVYPGVHPTDPLWRPNVHEYYSQWEPHSLTARPKPSDISHDFHSMYCSLVVEGVVGLTPRTDERIELRPLARTWDYFLLRNLRYRGHDLTIVWDRPDGKQHYASYPEGFSLFIDDELAFTRQQIDHVVFDPGLGRIEVVASP